MPPSFSSDLGEHVLAGETVRKQPVKQSVQLRIAETPAFSHVHRLLRLASSDERTQGARGGLTDLQANAHAVGELATIAGVAAP